MSLPWPTDAAACWSTEKNRMEQAQKKAEREAEEEAKRRLLVQRDEYLLRKKRAEEEVSATMTDVSESLPSLISEDGGREVYPLSQPLSQEAAEKSLKNIKGTLQKYTIAECANLLLDPVEDGGLACSKNEVIKIFLYLHMYYPYPGWSVLPLAGDEKDLLKVKQSAVKKIQKTLIKDDWLNKILMPLVEGKALDILGQIDKTEVKASGGGSKRKTHRKRKYSRKSRKLSKKRSKTHRKRKYSRKKDKHFVKNIN